MTIKVKPSDAKLKPYKLHEYREFDDLTRKASSQSQMDRIRGRLGIEKFQRKHGEAKCRAIFADIMAADERKRSGK